MRDLLLSLFYDGYSLKDAIAFCENVYQEIPSKKIIEKLKQEIKDCYHREWK